MKLSKLFKTLSLTTVWTISISTMWLGSRSVSAQAASSSIVPVCDVHLVKLHGHQPPTITCAKQHISYNGNASPQIFQDPCSQINYLSAQINTASSGTYCFSGSGYTGINPNLYNVTKVYGWHCSWGWIMTYTNGRPGTKVYFNDFGSYRGPSAPWGKVTQIEVDSIGGC